VMLPSLRARLQASAYRFLEHHDLARDALETLFTCGNICQQTSKEMSMISPCACARVRACVLYEYRLAPRWSWLALARAVEWVEWVEW
jgi:hypothetical protein